MKRLLKLTIGAGDYGGAPGSLFLLDPNSIISIRMRGEPKMSPTVTHVVHSGVASYSGWTVVQETPEQIMEMIERIRDVEEKVI